MRRHRSARALVAVGITVAVVMATASTGLGATNGAGKPVPGVGFGTGAALSNPNCDQTTARVNFLNVGVGLPCAKEWKAGADNGGATAPGVTADQVTVVALIANDEQLAAAKASGGASITNRTTGEEGTQQDALHDMLAPYEHVYGAWGREVNLKYVTSSGNDETAQRADALAVSAMKPFAVLDTVLTGLDVFDTVIAQKKIHVIGFATTNTTAQALAPYRWGGNDRDANSENVAEFMGKQLVGKKAKYAGDEAMQSQTRKIAAVYPDGILDIDVFKKALARYGGKVVLAMPYANTGNGSDPTVDQEAAPVLVAKLKSAGITTVVMFTDNNMTAATTKAATGNEFSPEWIETGYAYQDFDGFARTYDQEQWRHAFGLGNLFPPLGGAAAGQAEPPDLLTWYWGPNKGTLMASLAGQIAWLGYGLYAAGPHLTGKTFQQGLFSLPAIDGAADDDARSFQNGYGRTVGLPYDEYLQLGTDYNLTWWNPDLSGVSNAVKIPGKGKHMYVNEAKRYRAGTWPTKPITGFFDASASIGEFDTPSGLVTAACTGCPSTGGTGTPGAST